MLGNKHLMENNSCSLVCERFYAKVIFVFDRYLDYGDSEWKQEANKALKSLET